MLQTANFTAGWCALGVVSRLFPSLLQHRFILRPCVIVCELHPDFTGIFALELQLMPEIVLSATRHNNLLQVDPGFPDEVGLLVIVEDGALQLVVVWGFMNSESDLLIPLGCLSSSSV